MSEEQRKPTPAVHRVSYKAVEYGTLYPYRNMKSSGLTPYFSAFKRAIAPYNPFAASEFPTTTSVAQQIKYGNSIWQRDPYPSRVVIDTVFPSHYDPMKDPKFKHPQGSKVISMMPSIRLQFYPRHCTRTVDSYRTCLIANDDDKQKCAKEGTDILSICPPWALDKMKQVNVLKLKLEAQANAKYRSAMQVADYNKGRTVADVPCRTWEDGERAKLRPNSIWADDRYADITQKEVDAAKERVAKRRAERGQVFDESVHFPVYDRAYETAQFEKPLYP